MKELSVTPESARFSMSMEEQLLQTLAESHKHSIMSQIAAPSDVTLNLEGQVIIGGLPYRFTHIALSQLCQAVCHSLYGFAKDMAGSDRTIDQDRSDFSFEDAVDVINKTVRRRFDTRLAGKTLLRNTATGTIDGILGERYKWLPNEEFFDQVKAVMAAREPPVPFYEAVINGRWLMVRFCCKQPYFEIPSEDSIEGVPDRFYSGFHFSNDETGQAALRGAAMLLRDKGRTAAISTFEDMALNHKLRHYGNDFSNRLEAMIPDVLKLMRSPDVYRDKILNLRSVWLGLGSTDPKKEQRTRDELARRLSSKHLPMSLCSRMIISAVRQRAYEDKPREVLPAASDRTAFDLYNAMGREAKNTSIRLREVSEQAAYNILMGKFKIVNIK